MLMYRWYTHAYILSFLLPDLVFTASQEESQIPVGFFSVNNGIVSECLPRFVLFVELAALNPLCGSTEGYYWSWWPFKSVMGQVFSGWDLLPSLKCLVQFSALDSDSIFFLLLWPLKDSSWWLQVTASCHIRGRPGLRCRRLGCELAARYALCISDEKELQGWSVELVRKRDTFTQVLLVLDYTWKPSSF